MPYTLVPQNTCHHCFPACLESFFKDNKINITQEEIVNLCPDAHYKGTKLEGSLDLNKLSDVEAKFPITIKPLSNIIKIQPPKTKPVLLYILGRG